MTIDYSNITKRGVNENKTVAEAYSEISNVGEEKYAMADNCKVVKTATGYKEIAFKDTDTKIVNGTASVEVNGDGTVSIAPSIDGFGLRPVILSDGPMIKPETSDGSGVIFIGNGDTPSLHDNIKIEPSSIRITQATGEGSESKMSLYPNEATLSTTNNVVSAGFGASYITSGTSSINVSEDGLISNTNTEALYDADGTNTATVNKEILEAKLASETQWRNGFDGATDPLYKYGIQLSWNNTTKKVEVTHTSGTVKLWTNDTYYEYTNGASELTFDTATPNENNDFFAYFNASGQLTWVRTADITNEPTLYAIVCKYTYDVDAGNEILGIAERHDAFEPIGVRGNLHNTRGTKWATDGGGNLTNAVVGATTIGISQGEAWDEDVKITLAALVNGSGILPKYYFDGLNASSINRIRRGSLSSNLALFDTEIGLGATGRPVYNSLSGTWSPQILAASDYMCMHVFGAQGAGFGGVQVDYSAVVGQASYNTISDARNSLENEARNLITANTAAKEAVLIYSFIIDAAGEIQEINGGTDTFRDWRGVQLTSGSGLSTDQDINSVLNVGNDAGGQDITNLGTVGATAVSNATSLSLTGSSITATISANGISTGTTVGFQKLLLFDSANNKNGFGVGPSELRNFVRTGGALTFGEVSTADGTTFTEWANMTTTGLDMNSKKITDLSNGVASSDAATVGQAIQGLGDVLTESNDAGGQDIVNVNYINISKTAYPIMRITGGSGAINAVLGIDTDLELVSLQAENGNPIVLVSGLDQVAKFDSDGTQTLPQSTTATIEAAGQKAVTTIQYCNANYQKTGASTFTSGTHVITGESFIIYNGSVSSIGYATLPLASENPGRIISFKNYSTGPTETTYLQIDRSGSDTICTIGEQSGSGGSVYRLVDVGQSHILQSDGASIWFTLSID